MSHTDCPNFHDDCRSEVQPFRQGASLSLFARSLCEMTPSFLKSRPAQLLYVILLGRLLLGHFADDRYTMMWEVSDGTHTGHVLGTIHVGKESLLPLDPAIEEAFDRARVVSFEIKPGRTQTQAPTPAPPQRDIRRERELLYRLAALQIRRDPEAWRNYRAKSVPDRMAEAYRRSLPWQEEAPLIDGLDIDRAVIELGGYSFEHGIEVYLFARSGFTKPILAAEPVSLHEQHRETIKDELDFVFDPFEPETLDRAIDEARDTADWVWEDWRAGQVGILV